MNTVGRRIVVSLVLFGCLGLLASAAPVADVTEAPAPIEAVAAADEPGHENDTVRHRNPDEYGEDGDLDGVQRWLERELGSQLGESTLELSQGEYDAAKQLLDEEYRGRFAQLVEVDGETGNYDTDDEDDTDDDDTDDEEDEEPTPDERFEEVRDDQEELADRLEEFEETRDAYDEAVEEGDDERARALARELEELADEIDDLSDGIVHHFDRLSETTGADLTESAEVIVELNREIQDERAAIRAAQFEETTLIIEPATESISFLDPLEATGTLTTANATPVSDVTLTLEVGGETRDVQTDDEGQFEFAYRPVDESLSTEELAIRYRPDRDSIYLGGETTVPVAIEQVEPTITSLEASEETAYGESIRVAGELAVADVPVDGVALEVAVADTRLGSVAVTNGSFDGVLETPATVPAGDQELTVRLPFEEQALAGTNETAAISVLETETSLSVGGEQTDDELRVTGALETADGDGVADQSIRLAVDGAHVATATTGSDGAFETTLRVPTDADEEVDLAAGFDGEGTNLAPAEASTVVALESPAGGSSAGSSPDSSWVGWLVAGALLASLVLAGGGWWYLRRRPTPATEDTDEEADADADSEEATRPPCEPIVERAMADLAAGRTNAAIQTGYAAVRRRLREEVDDDRTLTHWEFFQRYRGRDADTLREVTEAYERATFTPDAVPEADASSVLERVRRLCGLEAQTRAEVADD